MTRRERAQVLVWTAVMMPLFLAVIGLAIDGGITFDARRGLQNVADGAARAGATRLDLRTLRATGGQTVALDPQGAREAASAYLAQQPRDIQASVTASQREVVVRATREIPTAFLRIVGINTVRISATAPAQVRHGVGRGAP